MTERITNDILWGRAANLNRRLRAAGSPRHVQTEGRNGGVALDEYEGTTAIRTITAGTKREVADFLHAMMVGIDLANVEAESLRDEIVADFEALDEIHARGGLRSGLATDLDRALATLILDPKIRAHIDPKALAQAREALGLTAAAV